jgi:O-antigen/teichoic acid export membrane protein
VNRTAHNLVYLLASQLTTWTVTLFVLVLAPRYLGPDGMGQTGFAIAFIQFFTIAASLGTGIYLTRTVARDDAAIPRLTYNGVCFKVVSGLVASVLAVVVARAIGTTGTNLALVAILCFGLVMTVVNEVFVGTLAGLQRMGRPAMWSTVQVVASSVVGLVVLAAGGGPMLWTAVGVVSLAIPLIANGRVVWPWTAGARAIDLATWRQLIRGGFPLMVFGALTTLYGTIDIPILSQLAGDDAVGIYTLAIRFVGIPGFIAGVAMTAFFPAFSALGVAPSKEFARLVNRAMRLVVVVSLPAVAGLTVLAEPIIDLLYDDRFAGAVPVMQLLALGIPLTTLGVVLGTALLASDRQNGAIAVAGLAALLNPLAVWLVIDWSIERYDNGAIGAAVATLGTELFVIAGALVLKSPGVMDRDTVWYFARAAAAAGAMAAVLALTAARPLALRGAVGAAAYGAASFAVGTLRPAHVRYAMRTLTGAVTEVGQRSSAESRGNAGDDAAEPPAGGSVG